jgi:hypothetical protein
VNKMASFSLLNPDAHRQACGPSVVAPVSRVFSSLSLRRSEGGTRASQRKRTRSLPLAREAPFTDRTRVAGKLLPSARRGSVHSAIIRGLSSQSTEGARSTSSTSCSTHSLRTHSWPLHLRVAVRLVSRAS